MRGPRRASQVSGDAVAGGLAAQSRVQGMLANWERDAAKEEAEKAERDRQAKLRKSIEDNQIKEYLEEFKAKEEQRKKEQASIIRAQQSEIARLKILKIESERHKRLSKENLAFQAKQAEERAKVQAEEKARREAEAKAKREAEAQAQEKARREAEAEAPKSQANQAKDIPSLWHSFATSLLQQNDQKTNQQAKLLKETDDKIENSLPNWMALVSGLLKKQEEKKPELPPQTNPPPIDIPKPKGVQNTAPVKTAPSNLISQTTTRAPYNYSHSLDIYRLQEKFDNNHNISYNSIKNKTYFDQRVAKWDAELKDIGLITAPPRRPNEQRLMGFEGYIKYLDSNIKQLQTQELTQEELRSGKNPSVNQQKLKTLIAFHYLEMAKAFYSSGQLHMGGIEGEHFKKESVFDMVPIKYKEHLTELDTSINSYRLPRMEKENIRDEVLKIESLIKNYFPNEHLGRMSQSVLRGGGNPNLNTSNSVFSGISDKIVAGREMIKDEFMEDYNHFGGPTIATAFNSAQKVARQIGRVVGRGADAVADGIVWTGVRATPGEMKMSNEIKGDTGLGYQTNFPSVYAHDSRLRGEQAQASKLSRDTQPGALAKNLSQRKSKRYLAMHNQAGGRNFHGSYNENHGGR